MKMKKVASISDIKSTMYEAIKNNQLDHIKLLLKNGKRVNDSVVKTEPFTGYTILHFACMENNKTLIKLLIEDYKVDVNITAEDGAQPIHLACLYASTEMNILRCSNIVKMLLSANANADAELGQKLFLKHVKDKQWCPDFGPKMTLLTYTVIYKKQLLTKCFVENKANLKIISLTNKTLLMYALERGLDIATWQIALNVKDSGFINHRDNDGIPATHYLLHPKRFKDFRYDLSDNCHSTKGSTLAVLASAGADMYALINDTPETFLLNMAAYRICPSMIQYLLSFYPSIPLSKALYYVTLPIEETPSSGKIEHKCDCNHLEHLKEMQRKSTEFILKDLVNRRTFGVPLPDEEIKLMDYLIAEDSNIKSIVNNYEKVFIQGELQNTIIQLAGKKINLYDYLMQVYKDDKIQLLTKDENLVKVWNKIDTKKFYNDYQYFYKIFELD